MAIRLLTRIRARSLPKIHALPSTRATPLSLPRKTLASRFEKRSVLDTYWIDRARSFSTSGGALPPPNEGGGVPPCSDGEVDSNNQPHPSKGHGRGSFHHVYNIPNAITMTRILATPYLGYLTVQNQFDSAVFCERNTSPLFFNCALLLTIFLPAPAHVLLSKCVALQACLTGSTGTLQGNTTSRSAPQCIHIFSI